MKRDFSDIEIVNDIKLEDSRWGGKKVTVAINVPGRRANQCEDEKEVVEARNKVKVYTGVIQKIQYLPRNK